MRNFFGMPLITVIIIGLFFMAIYSDVKNRKEWEAFKESNNCKVIGKIDGDTGIGVGPTMGGNGGMAVVITSSPDKTGYKCDDGMTYWK